MLGKDPAGVCVCVLAGSISLCVNKSSVFMAREVTGTDLWSHQSHIPKQNVTQSESYYTS